MLRSRLVFIRRLLRPRTLAFNLSWRLCLAQAGTLFLGFLLIGMTYSDGRSAYFDSVLADRIASAVQPDGNRLKFVRESLSDNVLGREPGLWFVASDEDGRVLDFGDVPPAYRSLAESLRELEFVELRSRVPPYRLVATIVVQERAWGRLHLLVGGVSSLGVTQKAIIVVKGLVAWFLAPVILVTVVVTFWIILRAVGKITQLAAQASLIDVTQAGSAQLDHTAVPAEVGPLVTAFNGALRRIDEHIVARDRFLADAAHELRLPIAVLAMRIDTLPAGAERDRLNADLARLANIAEQLLDIQRLGGQLQEKASALDLGVLARQVASDVAPLILAAGYTFAVDEIGRDIRVKGDSGALERVIICLLQNAMIHGGGSGQITVAIDEAGALSVSDQGPGVPIHERDRIFAPFYRLQSSASGNGLGLHLASEIVDAHQGQLSVEQARGGGARFVVRLPRAPEIIEA